MRALDVDPFQDLRLFFCIKTHSGIWHGKRKIYGRMLPCVHLSENSAMRNSI